MEPKFVPGFGSIELPFVKIVGVRRIAADAEHGRLHPKRIENFVISELEVIAEVHRPGESDDIGGVVLYVAKIVEVIFKALLLGLAGIENKPLLEANFLLATNAKSVDNSDAIIVPVHDPTFRTVKGLYGVRSDAYVVKKLGLHVQKFRLRAQKLLKIVTVLLNEVTGLERHQPRMLLFFLIPSDQREKFIDIKLVVSYQWHLSGSVVGVQAAEVESCRLILLGVERLDFVAEDVPNEGDGD